MTKNLFCWFQWTRMNTTKEFTLQCHTMIWFGQVPFSFTAVLLINLQSLIITVHRPVFDIKLWCIIVWFFFMLNFDMFCTVHFALVFYFCILYTHLDLYYILSCFCILFMSCVLSVCMLFSVMEIRPIVSRPRLRPRPWHWIAYYVLMCR